MPPSRFTRRRPPVEVGRQQANELPVLDFRGLDMTTPYDMIKKNRTPNARNFRLYAEEGDDRRVAVSSRKGSGRYLDSVGEVISVSLDNTTGATDEIIGTSLNYRAMPFVPTTTGPMSKVALDLKATSNATGAIIVEVYTDSGGVPANKIATSGIPAADLSTAHAFVFARFIEAPTITSGTTYHIVARVQDNSTGTFYWRANTTVTTALTSDTGGLSWNPTTYGLNYKAYTTATGKIKGMARYNPANGQNMTIVAIGDTLYKSNDGTNSLSIIVSGLNAAAEEYSFDFADNKIFWVNGYDGLKAWDGTTVETITHTQLPILRYIKFHKNVLFGVTTDDPNKLVYSMPPLNQDALGNYWYRGWKSTQIGYVPAPKASDPITGMLVFQDTLNVFTRNTKWVIYGSNPSDLSPRQATGKKGALSQKGMYADENFMYFVADDGIYKNNGSEDIFISDMSEKGGGSVQTEFGNMSDPAEACLTKWKRQIRIYYPYQGSSVNNRCLIFHTVFEEWMLDTDSYVSYAVPFTDSDDNNELAEASSTSPAVHFAEVADNNLGKAIEFIYDGNYNSFGNPAKKKRINKLYPLLEGSGGDYSVLVGIDKDLQNTPTYTEYPLETEGAKIGAFNIGDGTKIGSTVKFEPRRVRATGYAYYWQIRIKSQGINKPVKFIGYVLSYRTKRM